MATQRVTFTEWTPDLPGIAENLSVAKNVVPTAIGYAPFPTAVNYSAAASESLNNVFAGRFSATTTVFAGGATKLFKFDSTDLSMDNVSKTGNYTGVERWNFVQFGDTIIAANDKNKLQAYTLGSSTTFDDLNASAPVAKYVTVVRDFVVAANLDSGTSSSKVQWSDINDATDWTSGAASQSDYQIIPDGGNITGITGGEFGLILLERAIVRMTYIGSPYFFQFDTIARGLGCIEGNSVTKYGSTTYFLGDDGFYSCDGNIVTPIGTQKVDKWFYLNANPSKLDTIARGLGCIEGNSVTKYGSTTYFLGDDGFYSCDGNIVTPIGTQKVDKWFYLNANPSKLDTMSAIADPIRKIVVWNFENTFGGRSLIIYNWQIGKWSYGETDVNYIASAATAGLTLEALDLYGTIDSLTTSLDSRLWAGGKLLFAGARGAYVVTFTGAAATAQLETGDIGSEATSVVTLARPLVDNGSADIAIASRSLLNQVPQLGSYTSADSDNRVSLRSSGKYHRLSLVPTGSNWTNAIGMDIDITQQGTR